MIPCRCECGWRVYTQVAVEITCPRCAQLIRCDGTQPMPPEPKQLRKRKSGWVRWVQMLRTPDDTGVGDTVQRIAAKFGGERFKSWAKRIGLPCGCTERQAEWNRMFPY